MQHPSALILLALVLTGTAAAEPGESGGAPARKPPAATPEWTDHNEHDPGIGGAAESTPGERGGAHGLPAQNKVLVAPAAAQTQAPCEPGVAAPAPARTVDREAGRIAFGDGRHGRGALAKGGDCASADRPTDTASGSHQTDGDPDRPLVTGRVQHSDEKD